MKYKNITNIIINQDASYPNNNNKIDGRILATINVVLLFVLLFCVIFFQQQPPKCDTNHPKHPIPVSSTSSHSCPPHLRKLESILLCFLSSTSDMIFVKQIEPVVTKSHLCFTYRYESCHYLRLESISLCTDQLVLTYGESLFDDVMLLLQIYINLFTIIAIYTLYCDFIFVYLLDRLHIIVSYIRDTFIW